KKAIVISLTRAQMGVIRNLCGLNWIIEPLGAQLSPVFSDPVIDDSPCASECAEPTAFEVAPSRDWLDGVAPCDICEMREGPPRVQAYWDRGCDRPAGLPDRIWPGVLSAECIVRSMLPPTCPSNITHAC